MSAPAQLSRTLYITRGANFGYSFAFGNDANGTPIPLTGSTATFDLVPTDPSHVQPDSTVSIGSANSRMAYNSTNRSWSVVLDDSDTSVIPVGSYRAWLKVSLTNGEVLIPVVADVLVIAAGE